MPEGGRRRVALETAARAIFADDLNGRVLPFDAAAAAAFADISAARRKAGRPTAPLDLMIAAVAPTVPAWSRAISAGGLR
jgi:toxin FitB